MAVDVYFWAGFLNKLKPGKNTILDVAYGEGEDRKYDEYPVADKEAPLVIFWYGGSWRMGHKSMYRFVGASLQKLGAYSFVVDYPKFPKQTFPGFVDDANLAIDHIKKRFPGRKVIIIGHSAGAHTVLITGMSKQKIVDKVVSISGPSKVGKGYRPIFGESIENGLSKPINYIDESNKETQFLLIHGRMDFIVPVSDSVSMYDKLKSSGISTELKLITLMDHILILPFLFFGLLPSTKRKLKKFIFS